MVHYTYVGTYVYGYWCIISLQSEAITSSKQSKPSSSYDTKAILKHVSDNFYAALVTYFI